MDKTTITELLKRLRSEMSEDMKPVRKRPKNVAEAKELRKTMEINRTKAHEAYDALKILQPDSAELKEMKRLLDMMDTMSSFASHFSVPGGVEEAEPAADCKPSKSEAVPSESSKSTSPGAEYSDEELVARLKSLLTGARFCITKDNCSSCEHDMIVGGGSYGCALKASDGIPIGSILSDDDLFVSYFTKPTTPNTETKTGVVEALKYALEGNCIACSGCEHKVPCESTPSTRVGKRKLLELLTKKT